MGPLLDPTPRPTEASILGGALGQGIARNFPQPEQMVQRRMLQEAFDKAKTSATQKDASPLDLAFDFLQATAGIKGSERYIGAVLPLLLEKARSARGAQVEPLGGTQQPQQEGIPQGEGIPQEAQGDVQQQPTEIPSSQDFLAQSQAQFQQQGQELPPPAVDQSGLFGGALQPTELGMGPIPNTYSPQQIQQVQTEDLQNGFPESIRAQRMEKYNDLARKETDDIVKAAQVQSEMATRRRQGQEAYRKVLGTTLNTNDPLDLALAENISERPGYRDVTSDVQRAEKVKQEYDLLKRNLDGFKVASVRPSPYLPWSRSQYEKNFKALRENAQPLIAEGMRSQIYSKLRENGWTPTETEQILNPLGENLRGKINDISKFKEATPTVSGGKPFQQVEQKINDRINKQWESFLQKNIKQGKVDPKNRDVLQPGTSLVLLRNEYMKKGGNWQDFESMILKLRDEGKIRLDRFQESEMNVINRRPIHSLFFEEFMFGTKSL